MPDLSKNANSPVKVSRLIIPNDLAYLPTAISFVRENAAMIGFDDKATKDIELAAEEAVSNVIQHAFSPGEKAEFSVICEAIGLGLKIVIKDKGQPFDPSSAPDYDADHPDEADAGLGLYLMRQFMDEISFHILGREGKELHLVKYLHGEPARRPPTKHTATDPASSDLEAPLAPKSVPFLVRLAEPAEAIEISKCAYDAYGYSYGHEHLYYPERLSKLIEAGMIVSAVAVTDDEPQTIMAHNALIFDHPEDTTAEIGMAFTKKQFQNQGCSRATGLFLFDEAVKRGLHGILMDCTTAHVYSQKAAMDAGARACCILLGIDPEAQTWKHFSSESQRMSNVIAHLRVPSAQGRKAEHGEVVHSPPHHREMIERIYANLGESPIFLDQVHPPPKLPETMSVIEVHTGKAYQQTATIEIKAYGVDIVQQIGRAVKRLCLDNLEVIYLYLDLQDPLTAALTAQLEAVGFFFSGVIPRHKTGDRLELQYLNNVLIDYDGIQVYSDFAKVLLAYIQAQDPIRNALRESKAKG
jgi:anti-sigma regulatory factor (Ser/Thr protein kinase)